jgi:eukaryotic-like serine/threonine-protein kinase
MSNLGYDLSNPDDSINNSKETRLSTQYLLAKRYRIIREIGAGGFSKTYLAQDLGSVEHSRCLIKQLQTQFSSNAAWQESVKRRFANEAIVQQRLGSHFQIPQLFAYFEENQQFYLVQEFIDGEELKKEVEHQVLNESQAIALLQDVLGILDFIHKNNVIHRDIKPSNLIRRKQDDKFVLIDFGAVKELSTLALNGQEQSVNTQMVGTQGYMPPEQVIGKPTFASDIYALGRTVIYALTGKSPLEMEESPTGELLNWRQYCQVSRELGEILDEMCCPRCVKRYDSVAEVLEDLEGLLSIDRTIGEGYHIVRYLGGKLGNRVYLAENLRQPYQSPCIIKQIQPHTDAFINWKQAEHRFHRELQTLQKVGFHEQIPSIWDSFEENREFYLVQEWIDGENLQQKLEKSKRLNEAEVIQLLEEVLAILAFIHQYQFIHCQIKPSNLILRRSDRKYVLIGFDLVKNLTDLNPEITETKTYSSSSRVEDYIPPEQIVNRPVFSSDLYALAMTAIQALTGVEPEQLHTELRLEDLFRQAEVKVNPRLTQVLQKMIYLDCGRRYQSATAIHDDLQKLARNKTTNLGLALTKISQIQGYENSSINLIRPINWQPWLNRQRILAIIGITALGIGIIEIINPIIRPSYYTLEGKQLLSDSPITALFKFQQAIDLKPNSSQAWKNKGDGLFQLERYTDALTAYDRALDLNSNNREAWRGRGETLYRLERYDAALIAYDRLLKLHPQNAEILNRKGRTLYKLGLHQQALAVQEEALKIDPNNGQVLSDKGVALMGLGQYQEALNVFNQAQIIMPREPRYWQDKALVLSYLNRPQEALRVYKEALDAYEQATQERPRDITVWLDRASVLSQLQRHQEALFNYEQILKLNPKSHLAWLGKGNALFVLHHYPEALKAFDEALEIMPTSYLSWHNRGSLLQDGLKDLKSAIASYDKALEINPNFFDAWRERGLALDRLNQHQKAINSFQSALAINPNDYKSLVGKGIALASLNRGIESLAAFDRATQIQPRDLFVWINRGAVAEKWGSRAQACESYQKVSEINPTFPPAAQAITRLRCK